jgi:hypothetical protein
MFESSKINNVQSANDEGNDQDLRGYELLEGYFHYQ